MEHFDYIIAGAGCAGRSLAVHLIHARKLAGKKVLLVDDIEGMEHHQHWCFWEKDPGLFDEIVSHYWAKLSFTGSEGQQVLDIAPYHYKMISADRFYDYTQKLITAAPNVTIRRGLIGKVFNSRGKSAVIIDGQRFTAEYVFKSGQPPVAPGGVQSNLIRSFKSWQVETVTPCFDPDMATLMDFKAVSLDDSGFFYTLPYSSTRAVVTYTLIASEIPGQEMYDMVLQRYMRQQLQCNLYSISHTETGHIPLYEYARNSIADRIIYLGTGAYDIKASGGHAFRFIQRHSQHIAQRLLEGEHPATAGIRFDRFSFYDTLFLRLLALPAVSLKGLFSRLFQRNSPATILKFLDHETSCWEELRIFTTLHKRAFATEIFRKLKGQISSTAKSF
jgi:lycopene beta-cyclase